jgi:hypothetical protein
VLSYNNIIINNRAINTLNNNTNIFIVITNETAESRNIQAIEIMQEIDRRIPSITNDPLETTYHFQRMFVCGGCLEGMGDGGLVERSVIIGKGVELEKVGEFCYLGDMLGADGGMDSAVAAGVGRAWGLFGGACPLLDCKESLPTGEGKSVRELR